MMANNESNTDKQQTHTQYKRIILNSTPLLKLILLILVFSLSTGTYFRQLFCITFKDILAFIVGCLWLIGDVLPCLATLVVVYNVIITRDEPLELTINLSSAKISTSTAIILLNITLYSIDLILTLSCYTNLSSKLTQDQCKNVLSTYRYIFFHIQLMANVLYLTKPWSWKKVELVELLNKTVKFSSLIIKTCSSIRQRLDPEVFSPKKVRISTPKHNETSDNKKVAAVKKNLTTSLNKGSSKEKDNNSSNSDNIKKSGGVERRNYKRKPQMTESSSQTEDNLQSAPLQTDQRSTRQARNRQVIRRPILNPRSHQVIARRPRSSSTSVQGRGRPRTRNVESRDRNISRLSSSRRFQPTFRSELSSERIMSTSSSSQNSRRNRVTRSTALVKSSTNSEGLTRTINLNVNMN